MFSGISWTTYFMIIILLLVIWYLFVGLKFYSDELKGLLTGKRKTELLIPQKNEEINAENQSFNTSDEKSKDQKMQEESSLTEASDDTFKEVESLVEKLKEAIADASHKKYIRQELLHYLQLIIKEFPGLKSSLHQSAINEFIISESEKQGAIAISEEEAEMLWKE